MNDTTEIAPAGGQEIVGQLTEAKIVEIEQTLARAVAAAEEAMALIREAVGPNPGPIPQDMLTLINQGAGFLRAPRDTIRRMFREWQKTLLQAQCAHDHGPLHKGRRAFCKVCEWEFVHSPIYGWLPKERTAP